MILVFMFGGWSLHYFTLTIIHIFNVFKKSVVFFFFVQFVFLIFSFVTKKKNTIFLSKKNKQTKSYFQTVSVLTVLKYSLNFTVYEKQEVYFI